MIDNTKFNRNFILWILAFCTSLVFYYIDTSYLQSISHGFYNLNPMLNDFYSYFHIFKFDILRFLLSMIIGFILFPIFNLKIRYIFIVWFFWEILHYYSIASWFDKPFWLFENDIDFIKHFLSSMSLILGAVLYSIWKPLQKVLTSAYAKIILIGLGIISLFLIIRPIIWYMNYNGYRVSQNYNIIVPQGATNLKHQWNWRTGVKSITFNYKSPTPESLFSFYDSILINFRHWPNDKREWVVVTPEMNYPKLKKYIKTGWLNNNHNFELDFTMYSLSNDPPDLFHVHISTGPIIDIGILEKRYPQLYNRLFP